MAVQTYPKKSHRQLSDNFNSDEFDCPCTSCTLTMVDSDLLTLLEKMRDVTGPLRINSGYRCAYYQQELRLRGYETASGPSQHEFGKAADVMGTSDPAPSGLSLEKVARDVGFKAVGVGACFVHIDLRSEKERRWTYVRG